MASGADPSLVDQIGDFDLARTGPDGPMLSADPDYGGQLTLTLSYITGGRYENAAATALGEMTVLFFGQAARDDARNQYVFDSYLSSGPRGYFILNSNGLQSSLSPTVSSLIPAPGEPFLLAISRPGPGTIITTTRVTTASGAARGERWIAAGINGFVLGGANSSAPTNAYFLNGKFVFAAVTDAALTDADFEDIVGETNAIFGLDLPASLPL